MPRYSEQFKRDAVALYENNEELSLHAASAELGVNRSSATLTPSSIAPDVSTFPGSGPTLFTHLKSRL